MYERQNWMNEPYTSTPMSAARLNHLEDGIAAAHDELDGRLSEAALSASIESLRTEVRSPKRYRAFRPPLVNIGPGVNSVNEGRYWFDGVQMHYELSIQMASSGSGFVTGPMAFQMVSEMEVLDPVAARVIGDGHAHDATTGLIYVTKVVRTSSARAGLYYPSGSAAQQLVASAATGSAPIPWRILDGIYVKGSYIPKVKEAPKNFLAYGDSIVRFENAVGAFPDLGWAPQVPTAGLVFGGGFARDGGTSAVVLANAKPLSADIGVSQVGVNDIAQGVAQATTLANVTALRAKVGADKWLLCKIPPYDANPSAVVAMNNAYQNLADAEGWAITDPWAAYRASDGKWVAGASYDGTHPNTGPASAAALVIRAAVLAAIN